MLKLKPCWRSLRIKFEPPTDGLDPRAAAGYLARALHRRACAVLITMGAGHFFSFPAMYMALPEGAENSRYSRIHFGAVGQGLPVAIGTGAGNPGGLHVAIEGDGSLLFHIQELDTVTRFGLQMVLVVWNDEAVAMGPKVHKLLPKGFEWGQAHWDCSISSRSRKHSAATGCGWRKSPT